LVRRASDLILRQPVSTGLAELDRLIGGLRPGSLHVFYGDTEVTDWVLYSAVAEASKRGEVAYLINTDYYGDKTLIDAARLAAAAKMAGLEYLRVLQTIYFAAAFNPSRQIHAAARLAEYIRRRRAMGLVVIHNASAFMGGGGAPEAALAKAVSMLLEASAKASSPLLATALAAERATEGLAPPLLPRQILEKSSVTVFFRGEVVGACSCPGQAHSPPDTPRSTTRESRVVVGVG